MDFEDKTFVLGIGAQKSGTTWLHSYLERRGDIYIPRKEIHYFDNKYRSDLRRKSSRRQAQRDVRPNSLKSSASLEDGTVYRNFFQSRVPPEVNFFGEITPAYALIGEAGFREIRALFGNVRLIFIMRDPVERFYSHMRMNATRAAEKGRRRRGAVELIELPAYVERSMYESTISNLERVFDETEILYLFYERLFREDTIRRLCEFVGVPYTAADFDTIVNPSSAQSERAEQCDERVREKFESTYRFCRQKFGAALPQEWRAE